ncbi:unnamed protein product [Cuscuta europaea]|uniref:Uncharacterized protein n=1 Tax=Cuscuta europaea TaxID=41803 RepID=A0A9P0ZMG6_CUSEU|nr:unnamed protein product [Cuscuta europaea]
MNHPQQEQSKRPNMVETVLMDEEVFTSPAQTTLIQHTTKHHRKGQSHSAQSNHLNAHQGQKRGNTERITQRDRKEKRRKVSLSQSLSPYSLSLTEDLNPLKRKKRALSTRAAREP